MPTNKFQVFDSTNANIMNDSDYTASATRQNGVGAGVASPTLHNKLFRQVSIMATAIATLLYNNGYDATEDVSALLTGLASLMVLRDSNGRAQIATAPALASDIANKAYVDALSTVYAALTHKTRHAAGGADALSPADIGAAPASHTQAASTITDFATAVALIFNAKIITGSYVGTGVYGSGNQNSIAFSSPPKFVLITPPSISLEASFNTMLYILGATGFISQSTPKTISVTGSTLYWYGGSAAVQLNTSGTTYYYFAIL